MNTFNKEALSMNRRYIIPLFILAILILLMAFRWDTQATKSYNLHVVKWSQDRWTGEVWIFKYNPSVAEKTPTRYEEEKIGPITARLTLTWWGLLAADLIWLLAVFTRRDKRSVN